VLPDIETLLAVYYGVVPLAYCAIAMFVVSGVIFFAWGYAMGRRDGIRYVWAKGEKHSATEYPKLYTRFKNGIED
jgi:hypothetical protein